MSTALRDIVRFLDDELRTADIPDYPPALNGLQLDGKDVVQRVAAAVDFSSLTVAEAIGRGAELLLVHHGMFWSGPARLTGPGYERLASAIRAGLAIYSSHLPLDVHPRLGNNALLAEVLGLTPTGGFARYDRIDVGVRGDCDLTTAELVARADGFARAHGGGAVATPHDAARRTARWGICTGAGASSATLQEAVSLGIDTMIVGEGPHHTAVQAADLGIVVIYAGHYATETLGVRALAAELTERFGVESSFIEAPTGL